MSDVLTQPHLTKARKPHSCDWCGKRINIGEQYEDSTYVGDSIYHWRGCSRCAPYVKGAMKWADECGRMSDEGYAYDDMREYMMESHPNIWQSWVESEVDQ